ncbi:MAG: hypothetical protein ABIX01_20065 [Chitinophagaceae bacterium]
MTDNILMRLQQKEEIRYIKADLLTKGITSQQFDTALDAARLKRQVANKRDPFIRLFLGPTLLIIAGITFYTNYYGHFWGVSTFIGLLALAGGLRLTISLMLQYLGKR